MTGLILPASISGHITSSRRRAIAALNSGGRGRSVDGLLNGGRGQRLAVADRAVAGDVERRAGNDRQRRRLHGRPGRAGGNGAGEEERNDQ